MRCRKVWWWGADSEMSDLKLLRNAKPQFLKNLAVIFSLLIILLQTNYFMILLIFQSILLSSQINGLWDWIV